MATVLRSRLSAILPLIQARVTAVMGLPEERVLLTGEMDNLPWDTQADQYVWIRPREMRPNAPIIVGAGRHDARTNRSCLATLRTRYAVDEGPQEARWLLDRSFGHLDAEQLLLDALFLFQPTDAAGNWLVHEPLQPMPVSAPRKDQRDKDWGESTFEFSIDFTLDLNQSYQ